MTTTPSTMRDSKAPITGVPFQELPAMPLNEFLASNSPVHPLTQATTPILFTFQARRLGNAEVILTGKVFQDRLFNLRLEDPTLDREQDLPVITSEELDELWATSTDEAPIKHVRPLQRLIAERMTTFSGMSTKLKLVGIMNTLTRELQPMGNENQQELQPPFAWLGGHYSMPIKFGPDCVNGENKIIDEQLYKSMHYYAALYHYVNLYEGDRAMNQNRAYSRTRLYLSPKGPDSVLRFSLVQRQNPNNKEASIGIDKVSFRGFSGIGAFCGSLASDAALAEPVTEDTVTTFDANTLADLIDSDVPATVVANPTGNPLGL